MGIKHTKVSAIADGADTTLVRPSDWNASHSIETATFNGQLVFEVDGGGSVPAAGLYDDVKALNTGTITGWTIMADRSGSVVVDIWSDTIGNFPPTVADTITGSAKPTLSSADHASSTTLTGWTTSVTSGRIYRFSIDSISTVTKFKLVVDYTWP